MRRASVPYVPFGLFLGRLGSFGLMPQSNFGVLGAFLVLENGLGHQWCAKGRPRDERTKYSHLFGHLLGICFCDLSQFSLRKKFPGISGVILCLLGHLGRSTAGSHMQSVRECAVETHFTTFCFCFSLRQKNTPLDSMSATSFIKTFDFV